MQEGSLRADVNVSVRQMGEKKFGTRCEIKNVNSIRFMQMAIEYEAKRQVGLKLISKKINSLIKENIDEDNDIFEISNLLEQCNSEIIKKSLQNKNTIKAIRVKNLAGVFGFEPFPGIRLGKEIGQLVRFFGIGGIFHSDELPNYGIENKEVQDVRKKLQLEKDDAFLIITGKKPAIDHAINSIINRIKDAKNGPIAETRAAKPKNETIFLRPRPGASRMYPETDIP
jgi:glutamyl-tRNA(Gln) amidotransferase subunit E